MSLIEHLNKAFESRVRLGIMAGLLTEESLDFNTLKDLLDVTDGNLASHLRALEEAGFVSVRKSFIGRKPNTRYAATPEGENAFRAHLQALEKLLKQ